MKNRKIVVVAFLLIAMLLLGVGYAALTTTLTIIGNAHIDMAQAGENFDERIYFSVAEAVSSTGTGSTPDRAGGVGGDDGTFTANRLATKGETSTFLFTIQNDSNVAAAITITEETNSNEDAFKVTYAYSIPDKVIPSGGSMDITVVVEVIEPITVDTAGTFTIVYSAETVDE